MASYEFRFWEHRAQATRQVGVSQAAVIAALTLLCMTVTTPTLPLAAESHRLARATLDPVTPLRLFSQVDDCNSCSSRRQEGLASGEGLRRALRMLGLPSPGGS